MKSPGSRAASAIGRTGLWIVALCAAATLFGIMILMSCDVAGRYLFNSPISGAAELIELGMGVLVFSALPLTTLQRGHVKLSFVEALASERINRALAALSDAGTAAVLGFLSWRLFNVAQNILSYSDTTAFLRLPIAPFGFLISFLCGLSALVSLLMAAGVIRASDGADLVGATE